MNLKLIFRSSHHWGILFLICDMVFVFLSWILNPSAFKYVLLFILLFTFLSAAAGIYLEMRRVHKLSLKISELLETPSTEAKNIVTHIAGPQWQSTADAVLERLTFLESQLNKKTIELDGYRDYIESWVHEIKTPLFLIELLIENRRDELAPHIYNRLSYIQHQLNENVERILYYARLQADHVDYKFTLFRLDSCINEVIAEYKLFIDERDIKVTTELSPVSVVSDKKVVIFMLSQLLSNALKYSDEQNGQVSIHLSSSNETVELSIHNNGMGVPPEDAPFIFDKGFTGSHPERQKATGMGLYLVSKYAQRLCLDLNLNPVPVKGTGFCISLIFHL